MNKIVKITKARIFILYYIIPYWETLEKCKEINIHNLENIIESVL